MDEKYNSNQENENLLKGEDVTNESLTGNNFSQDETKAERGFYQESNIREDKLNNENVNNFMSSGANGYDYSQAGENNPYKTYINANGFGESQANANNTYKQNYQNSYQNFYQPPKKSKKKLPVAAVIAICCVVSLITGILGGAIGSKIAVRNDITSGKTVLYESVTMKDEKGDEITEGALDTAQVTKIVADSVVEITTESVQTDLFLGEYVTRGAGSGVIITKDGYIITNNHVIEGAEKIKVRMSNEKTFSATLVGRDKESDLAVIKIAAKDLKPAVMGDSGKLKVGQKAIAVGNPLGELGGTVTDGIISALDREVTIDHQTMTLLQTSAAINPGNSGGGLFDDTGKLIGIVNAKSQGSGIEGLGFAIPINTAKPIVKDLIENGKVTSRVQMGVRLVEINDEVAAANYRVEKYGVYILSVFDGSGAQRAGLESGERIVEVENHSIESIAEIKSILNKHKPGDKISIRVEKDDKIREVKVELTEVSVE